MIATNQRVLVFSAHAADFCSRAGGTIMKFIEAGAAVHVHDLTYGERCESTALWTRDPKPTIEEVKQIRAGESRGRPRSSGRRQTALTGGTARLSSMPNVSSEFSKQSARFGPT